MRKWTIVTLCGGMALTFGFGIYQYTIGSMSQQDADSKYDLPDKYKLVGKHTAPAPSARFPADWYPPDGKLEPTGGPIIGQPYSATLLTTIVPEGALRPYIKSFQARDSAGRMREEEPEGEADQSGKMQNIRVITVADPVTHCSFSWKEPWIAPGQPTADVFCGPRKIYYTSAMSKFLAAMKVAVFRANEENSQPDQTSQSEVLKEKMLNGVRVVGLKFTLIKKGKDSGFLKKYVNEVWFSPELNEIVLNKTMPEADGMNTELININRSEPDERMFYPPVGYKIVSQK